MGFWDRRDFMMAAGAAMGGLTLATGAAQAAPVPARPSGMIVADTRFAASRAFAAEAARSGQRIAWIGGDITSLWYDELDFLWHREKIALSGLTAYGAFFCLERLALDRGLRVVFKGEHRRLASGLASHRIAGPATVVTQQSLAGLSGHAWAAQSARMAMAARGAGLIAVRLQAHARADAGQPPLLISWVLAPKSERRMGGDVA